MNTFFLQVLSKGRIVKVDRVQRTEITTINVRFTEDLVPAFRLLAYYFTDLPNGRKIVADSVWVDVKDVCKGKVKMRRIIQDCVFMGNELSSLST